MKFVIRKENLLKGLETAGKAIGKSQLSILDGIKIDVMDDSIKMTGSNGNLTIVATLKEIEEIEKTGTIVVDSKLIRDIVRRLPSENISIEVNSEKGVMDITCEKTSFSILCTSSDSYPDLPETKEISSINIPQYILRNMISGVAFAASQVETRPILQGILIESIDGYLNTVALDGYRLAKRTESIGTSKNSSVVVDGVSFSEISRMLQNSEEVCKLAFSKNHAVIELQDTLIVSRLLEGEYIKYASLLPKDCSVKITIDREAFKSCIERATLMAERMVPLVKITIKGDKILISSRSQLGKVNEVLEASNQKGANILLSIGFNAKYLLDSLKAIEDEHVILELTSEVSPCMIKSLNYPDKVNHLVLPVRLK
ncbi:DNA polymerase III subunit beta (plasmid) [Clostridium perfringens]